MDRRPYAFCSEWDLACAIDRVRAVLDEPQVWPLFWPSLVDVERIGPRSEGNGRFLLRWRAPGGYGLVHEVVITAAGERVIESVSHGQLAGAGRWELEATEAGTRVRYHWHVDANRRWMAALRPVLAGYFARNHDALMAEGGAGFAAYLGARLLAVRHHAGERARAMWTRLPAPVVDVGRSPGRLGAAALAAYAGPRPAGPWTTLQRWRDLVFLHWRVEAGVLAPLLGGLVPEQIDGSPWVTMVCMRTPRIVTAGGVPLSVGEYAQVNVRTYVRHGGRPMVSFLHVCCGSRLVAAMVRRLGRMPYHAARVATRREGLVHAYSCRGPGALAVEFRPRGPRAPAVGVEAELLDRHAFVTTRGGRVGVGELAHAPWDVCDAEVAVRTNTLLGALGIGGVDPRRPELVSFAPGASVVAWTPADD